MRPWKLERIKIICRAHKCSQLILTATIFLLSFGTQSRGSPGGAERQGCVIQALCRSQSAPLEPL